MAQQLKWLALGIGVPANPSKNRVYVWRKLKEYGAEYFRPGVAVLPYNKTSLYRFRYLAAKIKEMGGDASITELRFIDQKDEAEMIARFKSQADIEYGRLLTDCKKLIQAIQVDPAHKISRGESETIKKMVKNLSRARSRDYFSSSLSDDIDKVLGIIIDYLKISADDFLIQLARALDDI